MKQIFIALALLLCVPAFAQNGSGTGSYGSVGPGGSPTNGLTLAQTVVVGQNMMATNPVAVLESTHATNADTAIFGTNNLHLLTTADAMPLNNFTSAVQVIVQSAAQSTGIVAYLDLYTTNTNPQFNNPLAPFQDLYLAYQAMPYPLTGPAKAVALSDGTYNPGPTLITNVQFKGTGRTSCIILSTNNWGGVGNPVNTMGIFYLSTSNLEYSDFSIGFTNGGQASTNVNTCFLIGSASANCKLERVKSPVSICGSGAIYALVATPGLIIDDCDFSTGDGGSVVRYNNGISPFTTTYIKNNTILTATNGYALYINAQLTSNALSVANCFFSSLGTNNFNAVKVSGSSAKGCDYSFISCKMRAYTNDISIQGSATTPKPNVTIAGGDYDTYATIFPSPSIGTFRYYYMDTAGAFNSSSFFNGLATTNYTIAASGISNAIALGITVVTNSYSGIITNSQ